MGTTSGSWVGSSLWSRCGPRAVSEGRCGVCRRRCRGYDGGHGRRRWRHVYAGMVAVRLEGDAPGSCARSMGWSSRTCRGHRACAVRSRPSGAHGRVRRHAVRHMTVHDARRTCARLLADLGVHPRTSCASSSAQMCRWRPTRRRARQQHGRHCVGWGEPRMSVEGNETSAVSVQPRGRQVVRAKQLWSA